MYQFTITVLSLVFVTICAAFAVAIGGEEVVMMFLEFALRVIFPVLVLAVAGAVVSQ
tara:strand:+ start:1109 stop:1279 length:171 start_codon:yes stop_codon:yes gene_type:complete